MHPRARALRTLGAGLVALAAGLFATSAQAQTVTVPTTTRTTAPSTTKPPAATSSTAKGGSTTSTAAKAKAKATTSVPSTVPQPSTTLLTGSTVPSDQPDPATLPAGSQVIPSGRYNPTGLLVSLLGFAVAVALVVLRIFQTRPGRRARWSI